MRYSSRCRNHQRAHGELELEAQNQPAANPVAKNGDGRRHPRFKIEVEIGIMSRTCGILKGYTVDLSESGISAMLKIEVPQGEVVELNFTLPDGPVAIYATVCQRNAFRYGFQFVESNAAHAIIQATCRQLAVEQTLFGAAQPPSKHQGTPHDTSEE